MRHPVVVMVALVILVTITLVLIPDETIERHLDTPMLRMIAVSYAVALLLMLRTSWPLWTVLGAGLLATITADAMLYLYIDTPEINEVTSGLWVRVIRAALVVGGPFLIVGVWREWHSGNDGLERTNSRQDNREHRQNEEGNRLAIRERHVIQRDRDQDQRDADYRIEP